MREKPSACDLTDGEFLSHKIQRKLRVEKQVSIFCDVNGEGDGDTMDGLKIGHEGGPSWLPGLFYGN